LALKAKFISLPRHDAKRSLRTFSARQDPPLSVGGVGIGGDNPVRVQSMTNTDTRDVDATLAQIAALAGAGCEIVRLAVLDLEAAMALKQICAATSVPLIADIHFDSRLAVQAVEAGVKGLRINPGNIGGPDKVDRVVDAARAAGVPIRIGVNSGSVDKELLKKHGGPTPAAMVESALEHVRLLEERGFYDIKISLKSSSVLGTVAAYRLMAKTVDYPLHIGVTEAGTAMRGAVKSSVGLGILLAEGIGDTLRVSLTADPVEEMLVAWEILRALGLGPEARRSCPARPAAAPRSGSSSWRVPWKTGCAGWRRSSPWRSWAAWSTGRARRARPTSAWPEAGTRASSSARARSCAR
jgi:(E)-4-hydroxy-3-methylbut-2-enyl-diphosphate synthase